MRAFNLTDLAFSFALGCAALWFFHTLPDIPYAGFFALGFLGLSYVFKKQRLLAISCCALAGFFWCTAESAKVIQSRIPSALEGVPLRIVGSVHAIPEGSPENLHMVLNVEKIISPAHAWKLPTHIRLNWYQRQNTSANINFTGSAEGGAAGRAQLASTQKVSVGETWEFTVKLKAPRSTFNPDSFDYEAWLFTHHISAVGYVVDKNPPRKITTSPWKTPINTWRQSIQEKIETALPQNQNLGLIEALSVGVRDDLSPEQWKAMQATGTNHLVAIAGLHVGFVAGFAYFVMNFLWRRIPLLMLYLPAQEAAMIFSLLSAFFYSALAGFALPTERACIMLSVALIAKLCRRYLPAWHALSMALLGVLLLDPLSVFSESFWLSFVAVGMILFCMREKDRMAIKSGISKSKIFNIIDHFKQGLRVQWVVALGLAPLTLFFFHQISLMNFLANLIAIPWVGFLALPFILLGVFVAPFSPTLAKILWQLAAKILTFYWPFIEYLSSVDQWQWHTHVPSLWALCVCTLGCLILLAWRHFPGRLIGCLGFLPMIFPPTETLPQGAIQLTQLDVGQGLSTLIQTEHHTLIFDTGPALSETYDMGESVVVPALEAKHISKVDIMLISHADNDHSGGSFSVLQHLPVNQILTSAPQLYANLATSLPNHPYFIRSAFLQKHWPPPKVTRCQTGQYWNWDGVHFEMLSPDDDYYPRKTNDRCCVLRISNAYHSILLPGDIEKITEKRLLGRLQKTEIVIAPHHGSKSSSSEGFVENLQPAWVIYATGYRNRFHFPNTEVVERYLAFHTKSLDTAPEGQIRINLPATPNAITIQRTREMARRVWG